jgi:hypothetical protein
MVVMLMGWDHSLRPILDTTQDIMRKHILDTTLGIMIDSILDRIHMHGKDSILVKEHILGHVSVVLIMLMHGLSSSRDHLEILMEPYTQKFG